MKKPQFANGEIYHIYNRGVEKRNIFYDNGDYIRFIHHIYYFNNNNSTSQNLRRDIFSKKKALESLMYEVEPRTSDDKRKRLVDIYIFTLMPNHYHLLVKQNVDGGIIKLMQKIGTGYTMFFNNKYNRVGSLFQGRFKAVLIENNAQLLYIPHYIHLNPIKLLNVRGSTSYIEKKNFLENYRWSSYSDYTGKRNFSSVTERDFILNLFGNSELHKKDLEQFLKNKNKITQEISPELLIDLT